VPQRANTEPITVNPGPGAGNQQRRPQAKQYPKPLSFLADRASLRPHPENGARREILPPGLSAQRRRIVTKVARLRLPGPGKKKEIRESRPAVSDRAFAEYISGAEAAAAVPHFGLECPRDGHDASRCFLSGLRQQQLPGAAAGARPGR